MLINRSSFPISNRLPLIHLDFWINFWLIRNRILQVLVFYIFTCRHCSMIRKIIKSYRWICTIGWICRLWLDLFLLFLKHNHSRRGCTYLQIVIRSSPNPLSLFILLFMLLAIFCCSVISVKAGFQKLKNLCLQYKRHQLFPSCLNNCIGLMLNQALEQLVCPLKSTSFLRLLFIDEKYMLFSVVVLRLNLNFLLTQPTLSFIKLLVLFVFFLKFIHFSS